MKYDLPVKQKIVIPEHELEIITSRAGGAGGQHVNKTNSRVTVRWNVRSTSVLTDEQKERVLTYLRPKLTSSDDLIIHHSSSKSQFQNKRLALELLAQELSRALCIPKKRTKTAISTAKKEARRQTKVQRSALKKLRSKKQYNDD